MPDYALGKIYKIVGNGKVYIGSTTRPLLSQRMAGHRSLFKAWKNNQSTHMTSFECMEDPECYIELLVSCPCSCRDELLKCEGKWIRETDCVNKIVNGRTKKEYADLYYQTNKEKLKEYQKVYNDAHKSYQKEYREANKEKFKQYREANKEKLKE